MSLLCNHLRKGDFLTQDRATAWCGLLLCGYAAALIWLYAGAHGLNDALGRPLGTDFSCFYAAGHLANQARANAAYDPATEAAMLRQLFGDSAPFYGWFYPPIFLVPAALLAQLPYLPALLLWQITGLSLYAFGFYRLTSASNSLCPALAKLPIRWLIAIAFPAVFLNLTHGQNGLYSATLLTLGLIYLPRRPWLSGIVLGLMAYKPQLFLLLPLALMAGAYWRTLGAMALCILLQGLLSTALWGVNIWPAFVEALQYSRQNVVEMGAPGFWKIQSVFAFIRYCGGTIAMAYGIQILLGLTVAAGTMHLWHSRHSAVTDKMAALCLGILALSPYILDYDMALAGPAIALVLQSASVRGYICYEKVLLAGLWLSPLIARAMAALYVPLAPAIVALSLFWIFVNAHRQEKHARHENSNNLNCL